MNLIRYDDSEGYWEIRSATEKSLGRARRHVTSKNGYFNHKTELEEELEDGGKKSSQTFWVLKCDQEDIPSAWCGRIYEYWRKLVSVSVLGRETWGRYKKTATPWRILARSTNSVNTV